MLEPARLAMQIGRSARSPESPDRIGPYLVEGRLARGGMSVVYAGRDPDSGRPVALKVVRPAIGSGEELRHARLRMLREAWILSQVRDPNVVTVLDVVASGDEMFLVLELIEGTNLERWLCDARSWQEVVAAFIGAGRGLIALHELGIAHRDFKPANVLVGTDGRILLTDFGLAVPEGLGAPTAGLVMGTPPYMAPEQQQGAGASVLSDQFSFCTALAEALSVFRDPEHRGPSPPPELWEVIDKGLRNDPATRHASMRHLLHQLKTSLRLHFSKQRRRALARPRRSTTVPTKPLVVDPRPALPPRRA